MDTLQMSTVAEAIRSQRHRETELIARRDELVAAAKRIGIPNLRIVHALGVSHSVVSEIVDRTGTFTPHPRRRIQLPASPTDEELALSQCARAIRDCRAKIVFLLDQRADLVDAARAARVPNRDICAALQLSAAVVCRI